MKQSSTIELGPRPRILLIRLTAIGDVVVTTPVTRALREAYPDAHIAWVAEKVPASVLAGNPYVDEVIVWDRKGKKGFLGDLNSGRHVARRVRKPRFDVAIDFQGLIRSAALACTSGARYRIGNALAKEPTAALYTHRLPRPIEPSSRQRCLDLLKPLGIVSSDRRMVVTVEPAHRDAAARMLEDAGVGGQPYACLVPATTWPQKHWTETGWAEAADLLRDRLGFLPVWLGGGGDVPLLERIRSHMRGPSLLLAGRTSLNEAAALLQGARVTVAVDTGLMHISVAVGTPTVGVCGASYWPGFRDYERFYLLRKAFSCSPCLHHPTCGNIDCMQAIMPVDVLLGARALLDESLVVLP